MNRTKLTAVIVFTGLGLLIAWGLIGQTRKLAHVMENRTDTVNSILNTK